MVCACLVVASPDGYCDDKDVVTLVTGEWVPHCGENLEGGGTSSRIVLAAFEAAGVDVVLQFVPWNRGAYMVEHGQVLGSFPWRITPFRKQIAVFSDEIAPSNVVLFYNKSHTAKPTRMKKASDLKGYTMGGVDGAWYQEQLPAAGLSCEYSRTQLNLFQKLDAGRFNFALSDDLAGWAAIDQLFPEKKELYDITPLPLKIGGLHVMFSRSYPKAVMFKNKFNAGLKKITESGELAKILKIPRD